MRGATQVVLRGQKLVPQVEQQSLCLRLLLRKITFLSLFFLLITTAFFFVTFIIRTKHSYSLQLFLLALVTLRWQQQQQLQLQLSKQLQRQSISGLVVHFLFLLLLFTAHSALFAASRPSPPQPAEST